MDLHGKTALVQGGIHTLSAGVARSLHDAGAQIIVAHAPHDGIAAQALADELNGQSIEISPNDPTTLTEQIARIGAFHIAVISPRQYLFKRFMDTSNAEWDSILSNNFEQALYASQAAARQLIAQGNGGRIIFLSSVTGMTAILETSAFGVSLGALRALAKMAAVDLSPQRITVNVVAAGWIEAEWSAPYLSEEGRAYIERDIPTGRVGVPEDVGGLCCFLASEHSSYITGALLPVDGGYTLMRTDSPSPFPAMNED